MNDKLPACGEGGKLGPLTRLFIANMMKGAIEYLYLAETIVNRYQKCRHGEKQKNKDVHSKKLYGRPAFCQINAVNLGYSGMVPYNSAGKPFAKGSA
jgi:hypothetical protein